MPEEELVGWDLDGALFCVDHKPERGDPVPLYAVEIDYADQCLPCGEFLAAEALRRGWIP